MAADPLTKLVGHPSTTTYTAMDEALDGQLMATMQLWRDDRGWSQRQIAAGLMALTGIHVAAVTVREWLRAPESTLTPDE